jgi:hypothetical protein
MQINPKFKFFGLLFVLLVLIGSAGYIGWQLYYNEQSPEDTSAASWGGMCSDSGDTLSCNITDWDVCHHYDGQDLGNPYYVVYTCSEPTLPCHENGRVGVTSIPKPDCGSAQADIRCSGGNSIVSYASHNTGVSCSSGETETPTDTGGGDTGGGDTGGGDTTPPAEEPTGCPYSSTQARLKPDDVTFPWRQTYTDICDEGYTGRYVFGGFHDGDASSYASDITLVLNGPMYPNRTVSQGETLYINQPGIYTLTATTAGYPGEANCEGTAVLTCNTWDNQPPPEVSEEECGDGICHTGEQCERATSGSPRMCLQTGLPPSGPVVTDCTFTGSNPCQTGGVATSVEGVTVIKSATGVCQDDGGYILNYSIVVTNISDVAAHYSSITDLLDSRITSPTVASISNGGTLTGNTISWPAGTLAVGQSLTLTYTLSLSASDVSSIDSLTNIVTVTYDLEEPKQVSYTFEQPLECDAEGNLITLPSTGFEDYRMYYLGAIFIVLAIVVYQLNFGGYGITKLMVLVEDWYENSRLNKKRGRKDFEDKLK